jgi:hypothetical protein
VYNAESLAHYLQDSSDASSSIVSRSERKSSSLESTQESEASVKSQQYKSTTMKTSSSLDYSDTGATQGTSNIDQNNLTNCHSSVEKCSINVLPPLSNSSKSTATKLIKRGMLNSGMTCLSSEYSCSFYDSWPVESSELMNDLTYLDDSDNDEVDNWIRTLPDSVILRKAQFSEKTSPQSVSQSPCSNMSYSADMSSSGSPIASPRTI